MKAGINSMLLVSSTSDFWTQKRNTANSQVRFLFVIRSPQREETKAVFVPGAQPFLWAVCYWLRLVLEKYIFREVPTSNTPEISQVHILRPLWSDISQWKHDQGNALECFKSKRVTHILLWASNQTGIIFSFFFFFLFVLMAPSLSTQRSNLDPPPGNRLSMHLSPSSLKQGKKREVFASHTASITKTELAISTVPWKGDEC